MSDKGNIIRVLNWERGPAGSDGANGEAVAVIRLYKSKDECFKDEAPFNENYPAEYIHRITINREQDMELLEEEVKKKTPAVEVLDLDDMPPSILEPDEDEVETKPKLNPDPKPKSAEEEEDPTSRDVVRGKEIAKRKVAETTDKVTTVQWTEHLIQYLNRHSGVASIASIRKELATTFYGGNKVRVQKGFGNYLNALRRKQIISVDENDNVILVDAVGLPKTKELKKSKEDAQPVAEAEDDECVPNIIPEPVVVPLEEAKEIMRQSTALDTVSTSTPLGRNGAELNTMYARRIADSLSTSGGLLINYLSRISLALERIADNLEGKDSCLANEPTAYTTDEEAQSETEDDLNLV
jgi:hypothetical protein